MLAAAMRSMQLPKLQRLELPHPPIMCTHHAPAATFPILCVLAGVSIDFRVVPRSRHVADTAPPDGQQWQRVGSSRPGQGTLLECHALSEALSQGRRVFTAAQWVAFGVCEPLTHAHYCMAGGWCYRPAPPRFRAGGFYGVMEADGRVDGGSADGHGDVVAAEDDDEWQPEGLF